MREFFRISRDGGSVKVVSELYSDLSVLNLPMM